VPSPDTLPTDKEFKYVRSKDEINGSALTKKEQKDRYASAVHQTALRSLHDIFEADRAGHIGTIALTVAVDSLDPATGRPVRVELVAAAAERAAFLAFDLSNVVPAATLQHLGAQVSKSPYDLTPINASKGVRGR
jgi:restriction system protein